MSQANIDPKFALALGQAFKKGIDAKAAREETTPGVYSGMKVTVEIEVDEMRVGNDTDKAPTCSIPLLTTCALMLQRFQPNDRKAALDVFRDVMTQAYDMSKEGKKKLMAESGVDELEKALKEEIISKMPRIPVKGPVTVKADAVRVKVLSMSGG